MSAKLIPPSATRTEFTLERLSRLFRMTHRGVFWRHDVDYDIDCAVAMAIVAREHDIKSVFYIRTIADEYKLSNPDVQAKLQQILDNGHELGLHVDLKLGREVVPSLLRMRQECLTQGALATFDFKRRVSLHSPPKAALWRPIPGFNHAMDLRWRGLYVSDSRGNFNYGTPEDFLKGSAAQVNLHPEWWFLLPDQAEELRRQEAVKP